MPRLEQGGTQSNPVTDSVIDVQAIKAKGMIAVAKAPPNSARENAPSVVFSEPDPICTVTTGEYVPSVACRVYPVNRIAKNKGEDALVVRFDGVSNMHRILAWNQNPELEPGTRTWNRS